jgi:hypothetical protein
MGLKAEDYLVYSGARRNFPYAACYTGKTKKQCYRIRHQKAQGMVLRNALQFQRKPAVSRFAPQNTSL